MPGALISMSLRPALARAAAAFSRVAQVGGRRDPALGNVEKERRKRRDAGEAGTLAGVDTVGDGHHVVGFEPALMPAVESVALGLDSGEHVLDAPAYSRGFGGCGRLFEIEDGPVVGLERRGSRGLGPGDLDEMTDVADGEAGAMAGAGIFHVDDDRLGDAAAGDRRAEGRTATHLLGHGEDFEPEAIGGRLNRAGIRFDRVEIDHVGVGGNLSGLMERDRLLDQLRIAAAKDIEKHVVTFSGAFRGASAQSRRG